MLPLDGIQDPWEGISGVRLSLGRQGVKPAGADWVWNSLMPKPSWHPGDLGNPREDLQTVQVKRR